MELMGCGDLPHCLPFISQTNFHLITVTHLPTNPMRTNDSGFNATPVDRLRAFFPGIWWVALFVATGCSTASHGPTARTITEPTVVEAACGQCLFGKKGKGCDLAIRMEGKSYFVDGVNLDTLGDAHAKDGMCNVIRRAKVTGEIRNQRFAATSFVMLPADH